MPKLKQLVAKLQKDYPDVIFVLGDLFKYSPPNTIYYTEEGDPLPLLHELGHYLLKRNDYCGDLELIRIESEAWAQAKQLADKYGIPWDEDLAQDSLDTYRTWLHYSSLCKDCQLAGYQDSAGLYHCPLCNKSWAPTPIPSPEA